MGFSRRKIQIMTIILILMVEDLQVYQIIDVQMNIHQLLVRNLESHLIAIFFTAGAEDDDDYNAFFGSDEETARTTNHNLGQDKNTLAFILFFLQLLHHGIQIILIQ
ncbi:unnamed protein product [Rotaria magnacalcarata]|uniref:Uncharacterized protein n=1 Tax=Rotaria magnacalcarata TaxID=392030 RepID=A0A816T801_9BILA|nr:unnamed protein product [Rotaria magnacalcarata]CAF1686996.1 unnamed protein product [Rotaria magnacalcarata]CAF2097686.1 unnamed protein product [Rotaria magnacalcarata]